MIINYPNIVIGTIYALILSITLGYYIISVLYFSNKKYVNFSITLTIGLLLSALLLIMIDFIKSNTHEFSNWFSRLPLFIYIILIVVCIIFIPIFAIHLYKYSKEHISYNSIKDSFNASNDGLLYFDSDGACLLINNKMEEITSLLTKSYILNGFSFLELVRNKEITLSNGKTFKFIYNTINTSNEEEINEIIALDVTKIVEKNELLDIENKKLKEANKKLASYNNQTLELIRHKEILNAKINIHNEMNALVLQSSYLLSNNNYDERMKLLSKWENNALLLCKEVEYDNNLDFISDLNILADAINVKIICNDYSLIKSNDKIISWFVLATKEALLNIAKHTDSKELFINIKKYNDILTISFINDNNKNISPITKGCGLNNVLKAVNELNGKMDIINNEKFILKIEVNDAI